MFPNSNVGFDMTVEGSKLKLKLFEFRIDNSHYCPSQLCFLSKDSIGGRAPTCSRDTYNYLVNCYGLIVRDNSGMREAVLFGVANYLRALSWQFELSVHVSLQGSLPAVSHTSPTCF